MDIYTGRHLTLDDEGTLTLRVQTYHEDGSEADIESTPIGHVERFRPGMLKGFVPADLADDLEGADAAWDEFAHETADPRPYVGPVWVVSRERSLACG